MDDPAHARRRLRAPRPERAQAVSARGGTEGTLPRPAMLSAGRVVGFEQVASVSPSAPAPAVVQGNRIEWVDRARAGAGPTIRLRRDRHGLDREDERPLGAARGALPRRAPGPARPSRIAGRPARSRSRGRPRRSSSTARPRPDRSPTSCCAGAAAEGVSRSSRPAVSDTSYVDKGLENDSEYRYVVRAVRADPRVAAGGPPSSPVTATPADTTPPRRARPTSSSSRRPARSAWPGRRAPTTTWRCTPSIAAAGAGGLIRIGTALAGTTTYIDRDVRAGRRVPLRRHGDRPRAHAERERALERGRPRPHRERRSRGSAS